MPAAIEAHGVGKRYRLGTDQAAYDTLRDAVAGLLHRRRRPEQEMWALRDVDLTVQEGEALGIVGGNGAGKSTLLRVLGRITEPTEGWSRTRGRVGALLEVGTGFHHELSGRENVYLSGAIMGMSRRDVRRRFDEIVAFAGVEPFIETPLKRYSSGMALRLAFAVAAHLEPEIMLVDEVLAVGDIDFQRRCIERMSTLSAEGRTVVFISHDLGAVTRLCTRAVQLDHGRLVAEGGVEEVVQAYYGSVFQGGVEARHQVDGDAGVARVAIVDAHGGTAAQPQRGEPLHVEVEIVLARDLPGIDAAIAIDAIDGTRVLEETWSDQHDLPPLASGAGRHVIRLSIPPLLRAGDHLVCVWLGTESETYLYDDLLAFSVLPRADDRQEALSRRRTVQPEVRWQRVSDAAPPASGA
ncbi:MAG: ATP-binding cassette domain-containing protein [Solirubrobacteraceae bacterium]|nr:ATP-binding cassette domain-containing protein [Solirubrobacteraceae bacterium]